MRKLCTIALLVLVVVISASIGAFIIPDILGISEQTAILPHNGAADVGAESEAVSEDIATILHSEDSLMKIFGESQYRLEDEDFQMYQKDFEIVAKFLESFAEKHVKEKYICLIVGGGTVDAMYLSWTADYGGRLELEKNIIESLVAINQIFYQNNCYLDAIRIRDNCIFFDTVDGQYSLVYGMNKNSPAKVDATTKQKFEVERIKPEWYHRTAERG